MSTVQQPNQQGVELSALRQILEVSRRLAGPFDLDDMLEEIINASRRIIAADRGTVFLYDQSTRELYLKIGTGLDELRFCIDTGIAGQCACNREIINVADCYNDQRFNQGIDRETGYRTQSMLAIPLVGLDDELVGVLQLLNAADGAFSEIDEVIANTFASHAAAAIQRVKLLDERMVKMKLERDLHLARQIQNNVLPDRAPRIAGYDVAGYNRPADQTGGDIYDLIPLDAQGQAVQSQWCGEQPEDTPTHHGMMILLADATGHGVGPAISVTQVRAMLRLAVRLNANLDDIAMHINNQLCNDLASERFVTAFFGQLDAQNHVVRYHAPGQGPLLHVRGCDGTCTWATASTFPLGIMHDAPMIQPDAFRMDPGDLLVLLTDGFYEYLNPDNEQFGNGRVQELILRERQHSARHILDILLEELQTFAQDAPQMDDLTAVIIKRERD